MLEEERNGKNNPNIVAYFRAQLLLQQPRQPLLKYPLVGSSTIMRWLLFPNLMNQPLLVSNISSVMVTPLKLHSTEENQGLIRLGLGFGLRKLCGWFDLLSRRSILAIKLFHFLIIWAFTGVALFISSKRFSFVLRTWLSVGARGLAFSVSQLLTCPLTKLNLF